MAEIRIIGKPGSASCKEIIKETGIQRYSGNRKFKAVDLVVNYGLVGDRLERLLKRFPSLKNMPMANRRVGHSKLTVVRRAHKEGICVPDSKDSLAKSDSIKEWIEKRINSTSGKGIRLARGKGKIAGKYYQKFIENRRYELRVHAFAWLPKEEWPVQKRYGKEGEIAWNYKNGGHFVTVRNHNSYKVFTEAKDVAERILKMLNMQFGAVDFLVDTSDKVYFIEINSAPGFTELSKGIYVNAFNRLRSMKKREVVRYGQ